MIGVDRRKHILERSHENSGAADGLRDAGRIRLRFYQARGARPTGAAPAGRSQGEIAAGGVGRKAAARHAADQKRWRNRKYKVPDSRMAAGRVSTQPSAILRKVVHWMPEPLASIVPATPEDNVRRRDRQPHAVGRADRRHRDDLGGRALAVGQVRLADLLADGDDDALPADHRAEAERDRDTILTQIGMNLVERSSCFL